MMGNLEATNQRLRLCFRFMKMVSEVGIFSRSSGALWLASPATNVEEPEGTQKGVFVFRLV